MSKWKTYRRKLETFGVKKLANGIPRLSRLRARRISRVLGDLAYRFDKRGRQTALENLTLVFGSEKSAEDIESIARESYKSFAQTVIDQFWSPRLTAENYLDFVTLELDDPDAVEEAKETGAIWVTPHYSNFEWIALIMGFRGYRFTIVAQNFRNKGVQEFFQKNREVSGHKVIPQQGALRGLLSALKKKGHAAFLPDLTVKPSKMAAVIHSFGRECCVTALHAELMRRTNLKVIPGMAFPQEDGSYVLRGFQALEFGPDDTQQSIAQACWDVFEPHIRENPAPWIWMYKHWRYRPKDAEISYPSYSHESEAYEELRG